MNATGAPNFVMSEWLKTDKLYPDPTAVESGRMKRFDLL